MAYSQSFVGNNARTSQSPTSIFKISAAELRELFDRDNDSSRLSKLAHTHKGVENILVKLQTNPASGIIGDQGDLARRKAKYKENVKPVPIRASFRESFIDSANDRILLLVAIFAVVSIIPGMIVKPSQGWLEGVAILAALFISVLLTSWNDYSKDSKFIQLQAHNRDESLAVLRGKRGSTQTLDVWKLVVGDVILLSPGDKVPADCLVISSVNLQVKDAKKEDNVTSYTTMTKDSQNDPFLFSDSYVTRGTCKAVVCCVGENSTRGVFDDALDTREKDTELTMRLEAIGGSLRFFGLIGSFVILATSMVVLFVQTGVDSQVGGKEFTKKLVDNIVIALIMLIVAIPEGLPMTVAVSLAHSVLLMKDDNVLVRDLNSVEDVGMINDLCLGKTGTMTTENMSVVSLYAQNMLVLNSRKNTLFNCNLDNDIIGKLKESIVFNSQAYIEMTDNSFYEPVGNGTEVSLIKWLQEAEIPVHQVMSMKDDRVLAQVPFNSELKRSIIAVQHPELIDKVRIYVKGAPEIVVPKCTSYYRSGYAQGEAEKVPIDGDFQNDFGEKLSNMTKQSHRTIAFAYHDLSINDFEHLMSQMNNEIDTPEEIACFEQELTFLAMIALSDPVRQNIKEIVETVKGAGINIRIISGDNLETTKAVAVDVGILTREEYMGGEMCAMDAQDFRQMVGEPVITEIPVEDGEEPKFEYSLSNQDQFENLIGSLKVIGRAEPADKLRLVCGIRGMTDGDEESRKKVAIVGEGIADVEAFQHANVSFAVGDGTSFARNNCSMVLMTSDFDSCMQAVMWGRNIYLNVQRFLQFQITATLAVMIVVIVSNISMTESCLNAVQLIWINIIMDILGALALASTRPTTDIAKYPAGDEKLMTPFMYRQIFGIAMFQTLIMMIIMYSGKSIFRVNYAASTLTTDAEFGKTPQQDFGQGKLLHFTMIWNTFVFLQVFNMINCRDVSATKMFGFSGLFRNFYTWIVLLIIVAVQWLSCFTFVGRALFEASMYVDTRSFCVTVVSAASVIIANAMLKAIPARWIAKMPTLDENKSVGGSSGLMSAYDKQSKAKAFQKKQQQEPEYEEAENDEDGYEAA